MKEAKSVFEMTETEFRQSVVDKINEHTRRLDKLSQRIDELEEKHSTLDGELDTLKSEVEEAEQRQKR